MSIFNYFVWLIIWFRRKLAEIMLCAEAGSDLRCVCWGYLYMRERGINIGSIPPFNYWVSVFVKRHEVINYDSPYTCQIRRLFTKQFEVNIAFMYRLENKRMGKDDATS